MSVNTDLKLDGDKLTITVDMSKDCGRSKSGKSLIIASTQGNIKIPGTDATIGLNIYK